LNSLPFPWRTQCWSLLCFVLSFGLTRCDSLNFPFLVSVRLLFGREHTFSPPTCTLPFLQNLPVDTPNLFLPPSTTACKPFTFMRDAGDGTIFSGTFSFPGISISMSSPLWFGTNLPRRHETERLQRFMASFSNFLMHHRNSARRNSLLARCSRAFLLAIEPTSWELRSFSFKILSPTTPPPPPPHPQSSLWSDIPPLSLVPRTAERGGCGQDPFALCVLHFPSPREKALSPPYKTLPRLDPFS